MFFEVRQVRKEWQSFVKGETKKARSQVKDWGWYSLLLSHLFLIKENTSDFSLSVSKIATRLSGTSSSEWTLVSLITKWRLHWGTNSLIVSYYCLLYKLQTEPEVKPASLRTAFAMQLQSRSTILQSVSGFVYELNNWLANIRSALVVAQVTSLDQPLYFVFTAYHKLSLNPWTSLQTVSENQAQSHP